LTELKQFYEKRDAKFGEICELIAEQLGFDPKSMTQDEHHKAGEEAEHHIEQWQDGPDLKSEIPANPTALQHLLIEYCHNEDDIMVLEDELPGGVDAAQT
jgi:hypothetical protein